MRRNDTSNETLPRLGRADRRYTIRQALSSEALNCMRAQPNNVASPSHTRKPAASSCALCCAKVLISCANVALYNGRTTRTHRTPLLMVGWRDISSNWEREDGLSSTRTNLRSRSELVLQNLRHVRRKVLDILPYISELIERSRLARPAFDVIKDFDQYLVGHFEEFQRPERWT
jgi:hypothetical protein